VPGEDDEMSDDKMSDERPVEEDEISGKRRPRQ
jgi:hypothetical protein